MFLNALLTTVSVWLPYATSMNAYAAADRWVYFSTFFFRALTNTRFLESSKNVDSYANMIAGFTAYVHLGVAGWQIGSVPAATHWIDATAASAHPFVHVIAYRADAAGHITFTGVFHVEAMLKLDETNGSLPFSLVDQIAALAENRNNVLTNLIEASQGLDHHNIYEINTGVVIVAFSSQSGAGSNLQTQLNQKNCGQSTCTNSDQSSDNKFKVPVYVVYVDSDGKVRGYCVGPCPADANQILNDIANSEFGVGIGWLCELQQSSSRNNTSRNNNAISW